MNPRPFLSLFLFLSVAYGLILGAAGAQEPPNPQAPQPPPAPVINYRERPQVPFDAQRLKRKPLIDGSIADKEWDPFITIGQGLVTGAVYLNWDEQNLYIAARTDQPAWTVINIDSNGDGWLRGIDNLELTVAPFTAGGLPAMTTRLLDGSGKDTPAWDEKKLDSKQVRLSSRAVGNGHEWEIAIPKGFAGITTKSSTKLGIRADFLPAASTPTPPPPYEPHLLLDVALVETQAISAGGVTPKLILADSRLTPGEELRATIELQSDAKEPRRIRAVSWKGEGAANDLIRSIREVNVPALAGQKALNLRYSSLLAGDAPYGSYQLTCVAELEGGGTTSATASFSIADPFVVSMPNEPESISSGIVERVRIPVEINSALSGYPAAEIEIDIPAGWSVDGRDKKKFDILKQDSTFRIAFFVNPPAGVNPGTYKFSSVITFEGKTWHASRTLRVVRPGSAVTSKQNKR